jgi:tetratricopeptide (TPR) repeat protein
MGGQTQTKHDEQWLWPVFAPTNRDTLSCLKTGWPGMEKGMQGSDELRRLLMITNPGVSVLLLIAGLLLSGCSESNGPGSGRAQKHNAPDARHEDHQLIQEKDLLDPADGLDTQLEKATAYVIQNPKNGRAYAIRSMVYAKLGRDQERIDDLNKAIPLLSNDRRHEAMLCEAYYARGLTFQSMSKHELAIADFNEVLELDKMHTSALQARAFSHLQLSRYEQAMSDANRAVELTSDDPHAYELRSRIRQAQGDQEGAESDLRRHKQLSNQ